MIRGVMVDYRRAAFERIMRASYGNSVSFARDPDLPDSYADHLIASAWRGWKSGMDTAARIKAAKRRNENK